MLSAQLAIDGPAFTSLFQGCTRWNTFVGLAVAGAMYGELGLALMAVAVAAMIPLLNILAIGVLVRYASGKPQSPASIAAYGGDKPVHLVLGHRDHPECRRLADSGSDRIDGGDPR